ncbi:alpha-L-arabinofuranosidase C-terminal domain-containing protein [Flectobacillus roseus]|uniref:alpha-L-arabinofuranosidase C-terminal domain-containing protein n=1 Tax=Flectobacillus roseus TaxID=502259 RepID=UPI0024B86A8D|nr:alpha-L-arabinofuranosidase C-terminal domain-containing protein [Flectobacillus roseus]MDI9871674.1 alpha-L-arabinofuranosidase C-terminal domain-containing protein [Flectobacillus roseus]
MKKLLLLFCFLSLQLSAQTITQDSVYLFSYCSLKNDGKIGLQLAWSTDKNTWNSIGSDFGVLGSDYGTWGAQKRMLSPFLWLGADGLWHCVFSVNEKDNALAHASSVDLIAWGRQSYPVFSGSQNCLLPEFKYDAKTQQYLISWLSKVGDKTEVFTTSTKDFRSYGKEQKALASTRLNLRTEVKLGDKTETGLVYKVSSAVVNKLLKYLDTEKERQKLYHENLYEDTLKLANLKPLSAQVTVDFQKRKSISSTLMGIFFEDLNYAADGGLYAELIQNRDFEYKLSEKGGNDKSWTATKAWHTTGQAKLTIDSIRPIHYNNSHFAVLTTTQKGDALVAEGYEGIALKAGEAYYFSLFAKNITGKNSKLSIQLKDTLGKVFAVGVVNVKGTIWQKYEISLLVKESTANAELSIVPETSGQYALDMISLFPKKTFKGRRNGLRADIAQALADLHPRFVRFPGGCVAHGNGLDNIYKWKNTIGKLEERKPMFNLWGYHQSMGIGYGEYFDFCEDIGAQPLPVIAAGVCCQNSSVGGAGQQGGIPMEQMDSYIQDILDLIEWANGDLTTKWGKVRAMNGHIKPYNLKYIGIGNEDLITDLFEERFRMIFKAIKAKYPEIVVIGTVGPWSEGTDYVEGWKLANEINIPMVDEHYYQSPGWFINNQDYYDNYDRSKSKVYLGEYAAHIGGRANNLHTSLVEALHLNSLERNGDVVSMSSYAPLLAKEGHTQWKPDLIFFNNTEVKTTVDYEVQKLYGVHAGGSYIASQVELSDKDSYLQKRVSVSVVEDSKTKDLIIKLVNVLPTSVDTKLNLKEFDFLPEALKITLAGNLKDTKVTPVEGKQSVAPSFSTNLPAHSLTVLRLHRKK